MAVDREALDEYSRATNSDANLDEFMARMTRDDVIPDSVRERCRVEVTHVRNSTEVTVAAACHYELHILYLTSVSLSLSLFLPLTLLSDQFRG